MSLSLQVGTRGDIGLVGFGVLVDDVEKQESWVAMFPLANPVDVVGTTGSTILTVAKMTDVEV